VNQSPNGVGISALRIKGAKDHFRSGEIMQMLYKIDNSRCNLRVKGIDFKLVRILKLRQQQPEMTLSDFVQKKTIFMK
jgi:hypothetical protein